MSDLIAPSTPSVGGHSSAAPGGYGPPPGGPPPGGYGGGFGPPGFPPQGGGFGPPGTPPPGGFGGPGGFGAGGSGPSGFGGDRTQAEGRIKPPAITLLVFTVIGMLLQLFSLAMNVLGTGMSAANDADVSQLVSGATGIVMNVVGLLAGGFCIFAFLKMMKLQSRGLALTAVIFSMLPCLGSCWCVNLWVGIWALVVLSEQSVKDAFQ